MGAASELQLSLMALAVLFVAAVWFYNKWQEYGQRRAARRMFAEGQPGDPLAGDLAEQGRIEPVIVDAGEDLAAEPPLELADPGIDCLVRLELREELAAPVFWQAQRDLGAQFEGLRWLAWHGGHWRELGPHAAGNCQTIVGALQLADRSGPLGQAAVDGLFDGASGLAEAIGARADLPEPAAVLARAEALDRFCASVDWLIALQLVGRGGAALDGAKLRAALANAALEETDDGRMQAVSPTGQSQFTLGAADGSPLNWEGEIAALKLSIDVPLVADGSLAFDRLLTLARALMAALPAQLVDEARAPLSDAALAAIGAKIGEFQEKMRAAEIPAGGRRALRLYA